MKPQPLKNVQSFRVHVGSVSFTVTVNNKLYATEKEFYFLPHNHSVYEIQYISEGACRINTQRNSYTAQKGDICIAHPYEYHTFIKSNDDSHMTVCSMYLSFDKEQSEIQDSPFSARTISALLASNYHIHDSSGKVGELFLMMQNEFNEGKPGCTDAVRGLVTTLMTKIFQLLLPENSSMSKTMDYMNESARMITIERFFLFNYHRDVTIYDLAGELYVCSRRVNQILKEMYDCSFTKKLMITRLEVAKFLLEHSDYTVSDICTMCGFNAKNHFHSTFRKEIGRTPQEYRIECFNN
mgnify:CR=1 FL=1